MIDVRIDTSELDGLLERFPAVFPAAAARALPDIGAAVAERATRAFRYPALRPAEWAPRKGRDDGRPLLVRSSKMLRSMESRVVGPDTVLAGSSSEYAKYHQHGTKSMPARPFFPVEPDGSLVPAMERKVARLVEEAFEEELGRLVTSD